ncbi:hypothetical protein POVWA2_031640 [Plasmodium ovale wallikeri]|uniref:Uncharacterized protein n=1 Tax=Plasmodium ovale wallikeri TaxID=864142 RepID=A0A1A8YYW9_PLAOA|nr:hypothetical protein POVWA1_031920 [Plasmodium ovale wallikeri]SBT36732.1 hypothetical protein POVWA2_031640 [Plasmodium ovale wallikeri]
MRPHVGLVRNFGVKQHPRENVAKLKHARRDSSATITHTIEALLTIAAYRRCYNCAVACNSKGKPHLKICLFTFHFLTTYE